MRDSYTLYLIFDDGHLRVMQGYPIMPPLQPFPTAVNKIDLNIIQFVVSTVTFTVLRKKLVFLTFSKAWFSNNRKDHAIVARPLRLYENLT